MMNFRMFLDEQLKRDEEETMKALEELEEAKKGFLKSREELDKLAKNLGFNKGR